MNQLKNVLDQLNGLDLQGNAMAAQFDWANSTGEKYIHFGESYPAPGCFISHTQIAERRTSVGPEQAWNQTRSENYRDKTICTRIWDRCRIFITPIRLTGIPIASV